MATRTRSRERDRQGRTPAADAAPANGHRSSKSSRATGIVAGNGTSTAGKVAPAAGKVAPTAGTGERDLAEMDGLLIGEGAPTEPLVEAKPTAAVVRAADRAPSSWGLGDGQAIPWE